jgi:hypothetical protein
MRLWLLWYLDGMRENVKPLLWVILLTAFFGLLVTKFPHDHSRCSVPYGNRPVMNW